MTQKEDAFQPLNMPDLEEIVNEAGEEGLQMTLGAFKLTNSSLGCPHSETVPNYPQSFHDKPFVWRQEKGTVAGWGIAQHSYVFNVSVRESSLRTVIHKPFRLESFMKQESTRFRQNLVVLRTKFLGRS